MCDARGASGEGVEDDAEARTENDEEEVHVLHEVVL